MRKLHGESVAIDETAFRATPRTWLSNQTSPQMSWLLLHADDGVIWGKRQADGSLLLSSDVFTNPQQHGSVVVGLRAETLQEARVFGPDGEMHLWRTPTGFKAWLLTETNLGLEPLPEEKHLLWHMGSPKAVSSEAGFAVLQEGAQAQHHAPPVIPRGARRPALIVRHYVDYDEEGQAYIALSRLVGLEG